LPVEGVWRPSPGTSWQWQLNGLPIDHSIEAEMYDIDLFDTDAATVAALHAEGRIVICYVNAGGWEDWRPDAAMFPDAVIGANLDDWEGERWLDIRRIDVFAKSNAGILVIENKIWTGSSAKRRDAGRFKAPSRKSRV